MGSEYIALNLAMEKIIGVRYKLRMMGVEINEPASIFCDNESVAKSEVNPEATLKKKKLSIAYRKCRECFAAGVADIYFIYSEDNLADLLTKGPTCGETKFIKNYYVKVYILIHIQCVVAI